MTDSIFSRFIPSGLIYPGRPLSRSLSMGSLAAALIGAALAGCTAVPNPPDYGQAPDNYQDIVMNWLKAHRNNAAGLRDISMTPPVQEKMWVGNMYGGYVYGYKTCVSYDAPTNFGAYTGLKHYTYILKDGAVAHAGPYDLINEGC